MTAKTQRNKQTRENSQLEALATGPGKEQSSIWISDKDPPPRRPGALRLS